MTPCSFEKDGEVLGEYQNRRQCLQMIKNYCRQNELIPLKRKMIMKTMPKWLKYSLLFNLAFGERNPDLDLFAYRFYHPSLLLL